MIGGGFGGGIQRQGFQLQCNGSTLQPIDLEACISTLTTHGLGAARGQRLRQSRVRLSQPTRDYK